MQNWIPECASCGSKNIKTTVALDHWQYGEGPTAVTLHAEVPGRKCLDCGEQFLDCEGMDARDRATFEHLKKRGDVPQDILVKLFKHVMKEEEYGT
jgi:hypothetical protein